MPEENDVIEAEEGRGLLQFILGILRSVISAIVDTGRNLVTSLVEWVIGAISAVVQRVITRIAVEV